VLHCGMFFMDWTWPCRNTARKYKRRRIQGHLTSCVLSTGEDQFVDDDCLYQHDSAPCYKARSVREWFMDSNVPEIGWPDLNPIEHL
jgi:hypothetical protein